MAQIFSNATVYPQVITIDKTKSLTINEEITRINKVKYYLGLSYFVGVSVLLTTLFI